MIEYDDFIKDLKACGFTSASFPYKEGYTPEEAIKVLTKAQMYRHLKEAIKRYGLERTEDVIKSAYNTVPKLKEQMLAMLSEIWKGL